MHNPITKTKRVLAAVVIGGTLMTPVFGVAENIADSKPVVAVKDSVITTKIKSKLAAEYPKTATQVKVETDSGGNVWLSGHVTDSSIADKAVLIASATEGVKSVKSEIVIKPE